MMLHINAAMTASYGEEMGLADETLAKPMHMKSRGRCRAPSDDLSTAAPSPEVSPSFGPQQTTPLLGPEDLLDCSAFQLPDAQESISGSDADFELAGFDDDSCNEIELTGFDDDKDSHLSQSSDEGASSAVGEDLETQLIALLSELSALRAESRQQLHERSDTTLQKIPYPQLESGFIPAQFMPAQSWLLPAGRAETGKWAYAMAPRPSNYDSLEPLNIVLGPSGVSLEVASSRPEEWLGECEQKSRDQAKAVFRRRRGRSRSPLVSKDYIVQSDVPEGSPRGRPRLWTH